MSHVHLVVGVGVMALFTASGLLGAWRWWRVEQSPWFWRLLRAGQVLLTVQVALGGVLLLEGRRPDDNLHFVYGLLPLAVGFVAEQLRLAAASTVLAARGVESPQAVGTLPADEQRSIVTAVLRRELGVVALGALVAAGLTIRAGLTSGHL